MSLSIPHGNNQYSAVPKESRKIPALNSLANPKNTKKWQSNQISDDCRGMQWREPLYGKDIFAQT